jgi:Glycosyl transferases group 1
MGRVIYAGFATLRHSGGVHVQTQHVRLLRDAGYQAWLWLPDPDDRPGWFGADVPVLAGATLDLEADDLLVLPEVPLIPGRDPAPGARKVIFNQNHFYTYATWDAPMSGYPGWVPAPAVWSVSQESVAVLSALHPELSVHLVPPPVDPGVFRPGPAKAGVALLPKKRPHEAALLQRLLEADTRTAAGVRVLADLPRAAVAEALAESAVFVALSHTDGFGLPVAEALMAGCLVVGYDGGGGVELFEAPGAWRVPEQRPLLLAAGVAELLGDAGRVRDLGAANRAWALERYSPAVVSPALLSALDTARRRPGARGIAVHPARDLDRLPAGFTRTG